MKKAFITGINGFVGRHCVDQLLRNGYRVRGIDTAEHCASDEVEYACLDLLETRELTEFLSSSRPDEIYHLAAVSFLPDAEASPRNALSSNILGSVSLLDAVRSSCPQARILLVSSSKVYRPLKRQGFLSESDQIAPDSFYGISKCAMEQIGLRYHHQFRLAVRISRSFNHTGPGQSPRFVCSDWAKQVAEIELGRKKPFLEVGSLTHALDFCDVRDVVAAYRLLCRQGRSGAVYNVCSGSVTKLDYIASYCMKKSSHSIRVRSRESRQRVGVDYYDNAGDNTALKRDTGWEPVIPLEQTLDDLYEYWMTSLSSTPV